MPFEIKLSNDPNFQRDCWHTWIDLGSIQKAARKIQEKWGSTLGLSTISNCAHFFALNNMDYVIKFLRDRGDVFTDDGFELAMCQRAVSQFVRKNAYSGLGYRMLEEWIKDNGMEKYRDYIEKELRYKPGDYKHKSNPSPRTVP